MTHALATTELSDVNPQALLTRIRAELDAQDMDVRLDPARRLCCDTGIGEMRFLCANGALRIEVQADSQANLHMLREGIAARLDRLNGRVVSLDWHGDAPKAEYPPNFRVARIIGRQRVGARFIRLRLTAEGLDAFARSGLHIRLLIPPEGRAPVWPRIGANGRTVWPVGQDALHMPAYTIRRIDPAAGHFDVDVFVHGRGPTCTWADTAEIGAEVGISGPGGGWLPQARNLIIAGDETALPAIARILENLPDEATGHALIQVEDASDKIALIAPAGVGVTWLYRGGRGGDLLSAFKALPMPEADDRFAWFAAEKAQAAEARHYLRQVSGLGRKEAYAAGYWTQN